MLESLIIENYAVVKKVILNLNKGMSAITGETGAGKSIAIDALELVLGGRADSKSVRNGANNASICATFNVADAPRALAFLKEKDLVAEDYELCIVRRTISKDGRSRAYINDRNVSTSVLKELSSMLLNIHGQHDGQLLLKNEHQIEYLDAYGELGSLVSDVASLYHSYSSGKKELARLAELQTNSIAEYKLTHYQIAELEQFSPAENEFFNISNEYDRLNHIQTLQESTSYIIDGLSNEDQGVISSLKPLLLKLQNTVKIDRSLENIANSLESSLITIDDVIDELIKYNDSLETDTDKTLQISSRMQQYTDLARKYNVNPNELYHVHQDLLAKAQSFTSLKQEIEDCKNSVKLAKQSFLEKAHELSVKRKEIAPQFAEQIEKMLHELSMPFAKFKIEFNETQPQSNGTDSIEFRFSANLGMAPDIISKNASGGEISRIALSILVLTANKISAPTMIFDEIDTGISGITAAVTGSLLRKLGNTSQVITVTHLPQVAASAHHQYEVKKENSNDETSSTIHLLDDNGRIQEIARLLGSTSITDTALANARELLNNQQKLNNYYRK
ncbi:MAG: DNA repair protein RecN [Succinivibrionaceae bacterium]